MPTAMGRAVERVRAAVRPDDTDAALLRRYAADRDGEAFAALVRRHGPMVLAACRRVAGDWHAAEDAFQATFLVLARRANDVRPADRVGRFLYGVARRTALDARTNARRRLRHERPTADPPDRGAEVPEPSDLPGVLDAELSRLPAKYRDAVVECDLLGRPRADAAASLGIPAGTLSSRLATARKRLAERLTARGLAPVMAFAVSPVPAALADSTCRIAAGGPVPPAVASLTRGAVVMSVSKKLALAAVGLVAVLAVGSYRPSAGRPAPAPAADASRIVVWAEGKITVLRADGTSVKTWESKEIPAAIDIALAPDRTRVGVSRMGERKFERNGGTVKYNGATDVAVYDLTDLSHRPVALPGDIAVVRHWSADGGTLVAEAYNRPREGDGLLLTAGSFAVDARTMAATPAAPPPALPAGHKAWPGLPFAAGRLTMGPYSDETKTFPRYLLPAAGGPPVRLSDAGELAFLTPSPDGRRVLLAVSRIRSQHPDTKAITADPDRPGTTYFVFDATTGKRTPVGGLTADDRPSGFTWSPDGRRLLFRTPRKAETAWAVDVMKPDGTDRKTLVEWETKHAPAIAWR